jgi:hypothetical protein
LKKSIFAAVLATVLAVTLAACSPTGAKQIVLHPATGETDTYTLGQQYDYSGFGGVATEYKARFALVLDKVYLEI